MAFAASEEVLSSLANIHKRKHTEYASLLNNTTEKSAQFWDVVVVTAVDEEQHSFYTHQLNEKRKQNQIPTNIRYHVISDPPGTKIGCGGSTMYVLEFLEDQYDNELDSLKVLVIHAGGYSKRLPNHSATGKIFASVPCSLADGGPACSMLELKFILFIDFPKNMAPGVFVSCADDIEFFESQGCDFTRPGFTAMAHPAPATIGLTHGVFVLEDPSSALLEKGHGKTPAPCSCRQFLHKSSLSAMQEAGAFLPLLPFAASSDEHVFVDSNFYFDRSIAKLLLQFYKEVKPLQCEVDAYGDFLQPLGSNPSDGYLRTAQNVIAVTESLQGVRTQLYHLLKGKPLHVLPFVPSLFLHIGTCDEYLDHFCNNLSLLGFTRDTFNSYPSAEGRATKHSTAENISSRSCLLHSIVDDKTTIQEGSVLEFCHLAHVAVGKDCILSDLEAVELVEQRKISDGLFMQTLPIRAGGDLQKLLSLDTALTPLGSTDAASSTFFVTSVFGSRDDFKKAVTKDKISLLKLRGVSMENVLSLLGVSAQYRDVWPHLCEEDEAASYSLWNARLFPVATTADESARAALDFIALLDSAGKEEEEGKGMKDAAARLAAVSRISWEDALMCKDMDCMVQRRASRDKLLREAQ